MTKRKEIKDFDLFKKIFLEYQQAFGVIGYKVYFKYEPLDGSFADITINQNDMVATVRLDSARTHPEDRDIRQSAKHEALHLMLFHLESLSINRFVREDEIYEATEELVFKLEGLIA